MTGDPDAAFPHVLREYAVLADGRRGALVGPRGDISWLCFPSWGDEALLAGLIGGAGSYVVAPTGRFVWGGYYEAGTMIWRSRWITEDGPVECREALALPGERDRAILLRRILAPKGKARVRVSLAISGDYGRAEATDVSCSDGVWRGRSGNASFTWSGAEGARVRDGGIELELEVGSGAHHDLVLILDRDETGRPVDPDRAWTATESAWSGAVPRFPDSAAPRDARLSYAVLSGLTGDSGAMVAAATMSLPERADEGRSYDYRYAWIRDQCLAGQALGAREPLPLMDSAVRFVRERILEDGADLMPAYTVDGGRVPDQHRLDLVGYPGGTDIVGNHVNEQFQLDAFGEILLLLATASRHDHLEADDWTAIELAVAAIRERWGEPDAGIWELDPAHWTHSRLICAAGLRAVARQPTAGSRASEWEALADAIVAETAATATHPSGRWQRTTDDERVDVALLLPSLRGATPANDPRGRATLRAVLEDLCEDGYAYRYRADGRPLGEAEGAFLLCGFVVALALARCGERIGAARWFERNRAAGGAPGLLSEEYDFAQRQLRGNLPQAFVHALMFECATTLDLETTI